MVPPAAVIVPEASHTPKQVASIDVVESVSTVGSVMVTVVLSWQPLLSVTVTPIVMAQRPAAVTVVCPSSQR